ncbi:MAG: glyoxalase [Frankiales bacterium]|nr:glyoxalase [Frankiales bacterium]
MDWKLELIPVPVSDVDRARDFYANQVGFVIDHDVVVSPELRFVQLTPPGSACSICIGVGLTDMAPGSLRGLQIVIGSADAAYQELLDRGVAASAPITLEWGRFVYFADPDGNTWSLQELPVRP